MDHRIETLLTSGQPYQTSRVPCPRCQYATATRAVQYLHQEGASEPRKEVYYVCPQCGPHQEPRTPLSEIEAQVCEALPAGTPTLIAVAGSMARAFMRRRYPGYGQQQARQDRHREASQKQKHTAVKPPQDRGAKKRNEDEDEPQEPKANPDCPMCNGPGMHLGRLGKLDHFRCRNCGMDFNHEAEKDEVQVDEKAPPGFKGSVKAMKRQGMADDKAYALAWDMKNKGYQSHRKATGGPKDESRRLHGTKTRTKGAKPPGEIDSQEAIAVWKRKHKHLNVKTEMIGAVAAGADPAKAVDALLDEGPAAAIRTAVRGGQSVRRAVGGYFGGAYANNPAPARARPAGRAAQPTPQPAPRPTPRA